tara:strand:- start:46 stop:381 length:336 start_codon:yes stop_codon:yes gene_type:complete
MTTVGKIEQLTEVKTVELTEFVPYMDERELTDEVLEELGFKRSVMTVEETGAEEDFYYYELNLFPEDRYNDIALLSSDNNETKIIKLFPYEKPQFKTAGGIKTLLMAMQGE